MYIYEKVNEEMFEWRIRKNQSITIREKAKRIMCIYERVNEERVCIKRKEKKTSIVTREKEIKMVYEKEKRCFIRGKENSFDWKRKAERTDFLCHIETRYCYE